LVRHAQEFDCRRNSAHGGQQALAATAAAFPGDERHAPARCASARESTCAYCTARDVGRP